MTNIRHARVSLVSEITTSCHSILRRASSIMHSTVISSWTLAQYTLDWRSWRWSRFLFQLYEVSPNSLQTRDPSHLFHAMHCTLHFARHPVAKCWSHLISWSLSQKLRLTPSKSSFEGYKTGVACLRSWSAIKWHNWLRKNSAFGDWGFRIIIRWENSFNCHNCHNNNCHQTCHRLKTIIATIIIVIKMMIIIQQRLNG